MATIIWRGNAAGRAQVTQIEFPGKTRVGEKFSITCNRKTLTFTATTDKLADVAQGLADLIGTFDNAIPEFAEISAAADGERVILTGPEDGKPFTVTCQRGEVATLGVAVVQVQQGFAGRAEIQRVAIVGTATSGTFNLTFRGATASGIAYNASAATVKTALEGLSTIGAGNVAVSGSGPWDVTFQGDFAFGTQELLQPDGSGLSKSGLYTVSITTRVGARPGKNKIIRISSPSGGQSGSDISVRFDGATIGPWDGDAAASVVQSAFDTALGALNSIVTNPALGVWDVELIGQYAGINAAAIGASYDGAGSTSIVASSEIVRITEGVARICSKWLLTPPTYGEYALTWTDPRSGLPIGSATIPYDATAAQIQAAIADIGSESLGSPAAAVLPVSGDPDDRSGPFRLIFTGPLGGYAVETVEVTAGTVSLEESGEDDHVAEVQALRIRPMALAGTFTLSWGSMTFPASGTFSPASSAAQIQTEINTVAGSNFVTVTEGQTSAPQQREILFTFKGIYPQLGHGPKELFKLTLVSTMTSPYDLVETLQEPSAPICEEQLISIGNAPGSGSFTLSYGGTATGSLNWNASASDVEEALATAIATAAPDETNPVTVSGPAGGPWRVKFGGSMAGRNAKTITGSGGGLGGLAGSKIAVSRVSLAESPENERQKITLRGAPTGGTFTLTFSSQTTGAIPYNASAEVVQAALEALSSGGYGNFLVTAERPGGPYLVEFIGSLGATNQTAISGASSLTGAGTAGYATNTVDPTGPNWISEPFNYEGGALPVNSDVLIFEQGAVPPLYGLEDLAAVTLAELHFRKSFTATSIGLPPFTGLYAEYRPQALKIGATKVFVGQGDGVGCPLIRLNTGTAQTEVLVMGSGQPSGDLPAFCWVGDHASNVFRIFRGFAGIGVFAGDAFQLATLEIGYVDSKETDVSLTVGSGGGTIGAIKAIGGVSEIGSSFTTATLNGGELEIVGAAAGGTLRINGGPVYWSSSGTLTAGFVGGEGLLLFTRDMRARTVTDLEIVAGAAVRDPARSVAWTNPIVLNQCGLQDVELDLGSHITIDVAAGP